MRGIRARIHVDADHSITGTAPPDVPPGEHEVTIAVPPARAARAARAVAKEPFSADDLPAHDLGPWPKDLKLSREDIYGEDGR